ncbi:hypothetical protein EYR36_010627 [Pleurotus pulmonarius]|nr:hypothetical protein EYR36_010627 [Pleurotus pulmonarius]
MSKNLDVEIGDLLQRLQDKLEERDAAQATNSPEIPRSPGSGLGGEYVNELTPPAGTMATHTILDQEWIYSENPSLRILLAMLTWRVDVYTYVANAMPDDPLFSEKNGSILVVLVHSGMVGNIGPGTCETALRVECPAEGTLVAQTQLPPQDSGVPAGRKILNYTISYEERLSLFNNCGNGIFDFYARYKEDFTRRNSEQISRMIPNGCELGVRASRNLSDEYLKIAGVSVFHTADPKGLPAYFDLRANVNCTIGGFKVRANPLKYFDLRLHRGS